MATLKWGAPRQRRIEHGVSKGVLYPKGRDGVAWNGLTAVTERPSGGEEVSLYADNHKYGSFRTFEGFEATIEAYTYPEEFSECDGSVAIAGGVKIGQQRRRPFDFCYRTEIRTAGDNIYGNDYKLHLVFNATASPSERNYQTMNDSPDALQFSWELQCMPFLVNGHRAASTIVLDSSKADRIKMEEVEKILYGLGGEPPRMPDPDEIVRLIQRLDLHQMFLNVISRSGLWVWDTFNFREDTVPVAIERESQTHIYLDPQQGTEYLLPAVAYTLLSENDNGRRKYMVAVIDTTRQSELVDNLKAELTLTNEEVVKSGDLYYFTYNLYV